MLTIEGKIVNHDSIKNGRIEISIDSGLIESVKEPTGMADIVLDSTCLIFPGFGDMHIHTREDQTGKWNYKEDFESASKAAINGGVTFAMDMTNNFLPLTSEKAYLERKELAEKKSQIDLVLAAPIGPNTKPFSFTVPYKLFMSHSVGDLFFENKKAIDEAVSKYSGQYITFHCEDPEILNEYKHEKNNLLQRPPEAEIKGIEFAIELIEKYGIKGRIAHVTTRAGLELIKAAKARGVMLTAEVTPHHLYFDSNENLQMNPPLRSEADRLALIDGLKNGSIDFLASDHAPHSPEEREKGISGLPHLDTYGSFTTWLIEKHGFTPEQIAQVCSYNPGLYFKSFSNSNYGQIKPGFVASFSIIDLSKKALISKEKLFTKAAWSPFLNQKFAGSVKYAIIRGRVYQN